LLLWSSCRVSKSISALFGASSNLVGSLLGSFEGIGHLFWVSLKEARERLI